jgi:oligopeptidase B
MSKTPPVAKKISKKLVIHNDVRIDNYYWMKDKENPEVIDYINLENSYYQQQTKNSNIFRNSLFEEMKSRIKKDDSSVPYKYNGYWYFTKYKKGKDYPIYIRRKNNISSKDEILFDCNELSKDHSYFNLVGISISPNNSLVSYAVDTIGRRNYTIKVKDLNSKKNYDLNITNTTGNSTWANDNKSLYYTEKNKTTLRSQYIKKHILGTNKINDSLIYEEHDETFGVGIYKTKSNKYLVISSYSSLTTEYRILDANFPKKKFKLFQKRIKGVEYNISHHKDMFYIITNIDNAFNFKVMFTDENNTKNTNWKDFIAHRNNVLIESIDVFNKYIVLSERVNGLSMIKVFNIDDSKSYYIPFEGETYTAYTSTNIDFDTQILRYVYNSLTTPTTVVDFNLETKVKSIKKTQEILDDNFKKENYTSKRLWAKSRDGTSLPISIIHRNNISINSNTPLLLYAYGSYGSTIDPYFSSLRLSILDRGFVFAIAHVRGGEYFGRKWYNDGKLFNKNNTFFDFIDCSKFLINNNYTSSSHLYAMGGSAGGLLMGVIINDSPSLYKGIVAQVPFVDVITTMLDDKIPLTTGEYDEWGNPNTKSFYNYMKTYSPYDNIKSQIFPNILVTSGLYDSQVQYWEPTKWVAKIREYNLGKNKLFLKTNMNAGHSGVSGRFNSIKEVVDVYIFLLELEGISK